MQPQLDRQRVFRNAVPVPRRAEDVLEGPFVSIRAGHDEDDEDDDDV